MIKLKRIRTKKAIPLSLRGKGRIKKNTELILAQRKIENGILKKHSFKSTYWKPAKEQLKAETHGKCAYCEAYTASVTYGDIEHFRPKSIYWWLAYSYENYLYSCQICNQVYKKAYFPVAERHLQFPKLKKNLTEEQKTKEAAKLTPDPLLVKEGMNRDEFIKQCLNEKAYLIDPYIINPEEYFSWDVDDITKEIELIANEEEEFSAKYVENAELYYGLNRKELKNLRYAEYDKFRTFKLVENNQQIPDILKLEIIKQIEKMKSNDAVFAGMIRYFDKLLSNAYTQNQNIV